MKAHKPPMLIKQYAEFIGKLGQKMSPGEEVME